MTQFLSIPVNTPIQAITAPATGDGFSPALPLMMSDDLEQIKTGTCRLSNKDPKVNQPAVRPTQPASCSPQASFFLNSMKLTIDFSFLPLGQKIVQLMPMQDKLLQLHRISHLEKNYQMKLNCTLYVHLSNLHACRGQLQFLTSGRVLQHLTPFFRLMVVYLLPLLDQTHFVIITKPLTEENPELHVSEPNNP